MCRIDNNTKYELFINAGTVSLNSNAAFSYFIPTGKYATDLRNYLKSNESLRLTAYKLPGENLYTVGWGHHSSKISEHMTITKDQAESFLSVDINSAENKIHSAFPLTKFTDNQRIALVSICFNHGHIPSSLVSKIRNNPNDPGIRGVWENLTSSRMSVKYPGLVTRRREEAALYFTK